MTAAERAWTTYVDGIGASAYAAKWENMPDRHKLAWQAVVDGAARDGVECAGCGCSLAVGPEKCASVACGGGS